MSEDGKKNNKIHPFNIRIKAGPVGELVENFERIIASQYHLGVMHAKEVGRLTVLKELPPQQVWDEIRKMLFAIAHGIVDHMTPNQYHGVATQDKEDNPHGINFPECLDTALTNVMTRIKAAMEDGVPMDAATKKISGDLGFELDPSGSLGNLQSRAKKVEDQDGKLEDGGEIKE